VYYIFNKLCAGVFAIYDFLLYLKIIKIWSFPVPVVSIGNITVGGAGKTPFVYYLAQLLTQHNIRHVIVSRGYKKKQVGICLVHNGEGLLLASPKQCGDEPFMLACKLKKTPIIADNQKTRGITYAIQHFNPQIVLLDDSFQSKYIKKNLDIVLFNTLNTKEELRFFPFGKLRESVHSLGRAHLIVFTKHNLGTVNSSGVDSVLPIIKKNKIPYIYSNAIVSLIQYSVGGVGSCVWGPPVTIKTLPAEQKLFSFCGIGDPISFEQTSKPYQNYIVKHAVFSDHYSYHDNEKEFLKSLQRLHSQVHITGVLTTQKDFVKIKHLSNSFLTWCVETQLSFFILDIETAVPDDDFVLEQLKNLIP